MTLGTKFLVIGLWLLVHTCTQSKGFFLRTGQTAFESLFHPWLTAVLLRAETVAKPESQELPDVKRLITASYKGLNYVMVTNVSLGFVEAERYCQNAFTYPMQLASIESEDEWHMLTRVFGTNDSSKIWLGGTVRRPHIKMFVFRWLDSAQFIYNRFQPTERYRLIQNWQVNSQGCIVGDRQSDGLGNWTADLTPCTEPRPFVCKETAKPSPPQTPPQFDWSNLWNSLLLPPTSRPLPSKDKRFSDSDRVRFQAIRQPKPVTTINQQGTVNSQTTTETPRVVETQTTSTVASSTEPANMPGPSSESRIAPRSTVETASMASGPNPNNNTSSTASPQPTPQLLNSESKANEVERVPRFTFFRTAPRALVEPADRTDVHLSQSNPTTLTLPSTGVIAAQVIPSPNTLWYSTRYGDQSDY